MTSQPSRPSWAVRMGWALLLVAAATGLRAAMSPFVTGLRFLPYVPAVLAAALLGGTPAGLAVTAMATVIGIAWAPPPSVHTNVATTPAITTLFLGTALVSVWLCSRVRRARVDALVAAELVRQADLRLRAAHDLEASRNAADLTLGQLKAVFEGMSEGVIVANAAGLLVEWNPAALRIHGYASIDEVRRHVTRFDTDYQITDDSGPLPPADWPVARVLRGEHFENLELTVRRLDRPRVSVVAYSGTPVRDASGRVALAVLTLHDVTDERRAQAAVRRNAERLSLALEAGGLGDWEWDAATDAMTLSPAAAALFGVAPDVAVTREAMRGLLHPADRTRARRANEQAMTSDDGYDVEYRVRRPDGPTVWIAARGRAERDAAGRAVRMHGVVQDVTARKRSEQALLDSRTWLEQAVSIAQMGTFQIDLPEYAVSINEAGRAVFGYSADEAITYDGVNARLHPDDAEAVLAATRAATDPDGTRRFEMEHRLIRTDGAVRWARVRGRCLFEETPAGLRPVRIVGTFLDVTEQKAADQQREAVLAASQAARADAEHASRMKDEFLSTLSHELRTPLNAILGWTQILQAGPPTADDVEQGLAVIDRNAKAQQQIIEDLLDMSRILNGKVRLEVGPLDLVALADTAIDTVRPTAEAKGVRLVTAVVAPIGPVTGDGGRVQQILWNLLTNAIKFTPGGGQVTLAVTPRAGFVDLIVADTGEGIAPEFMPHVFGRFRQADASTTRRHGGLGLGLSIVRQLAELHGGTATAASGGKGQGATFTVTLPTSAVIAAGTPNPAPSRPALAGSHEHCTALTGLRVLVVDDEPDARAVLDRLLRDCAADVTPAANAAEAVAVLQSAPAPFDALVSDIGMPGEDGYALLARVRTLPQGVRLPAIALTAYARSEDRTRALSAGFQAHLPKPVQASALVATLAELAGRTAGV